MASYELLEENVPDSWFEGQLDYVSSNNSVLRTLLASKVEALKSFYDGTLSTDDAAKAITQPITDSPVPELNTYSDDFPALIELWGLIITALIEWPSSQTPSLVALLEAIKKIPSPPYRGEPPPDDDKPVS